MKKAITSLILSLVFLVAFGTAVNAQVNKILYAGYGQTNNHRAKIKFSSPLEGNWSKYGFLVTAGGAILSPAGAHVIAFDMDTNNKNVAAFEVYTDQAIAQFWWIVVQL